MESKKIELADAFKIIKGARNQILKEGKDEESCNPPLSASRLRQDKKIRKEKLFLLDTIQHIFEFLGTKE